MLHEFAFDPALASNWNELWKLLDQCRVRHGRLIAAYPENWRKRVREVIRAGVHGDLERKRILVQLEKQLGPLQKHADPEYREGKWLECAEGACSKPPRITAIVAEANPRSHPAVLEASSIADDTKLWRVEREVIVPQSAEAIMPLLEPMLRISREVAFVDPHFSLSPEKQGYRTAFKHIIRAVTAHGRRARAIEFHVKASGDRVPSLSYFSDVCRSFVAKEVPAGQEVRFVRWIDEPGQLHPRYLLTEHGGIGVDGGWDEKAPGKDTELRLMEESVWQQRRIDYSDASTRFKKEADLLFTGEAA